MDVAYRRVEDAEETRSTAELLTFPSRSASLATEPFVPAHLQLPPKRPHWVALCGVGAAHAVLLAALLTWQVVVVERPKREPTVVKLIELPTEPPEVAPPPPEMKVVPVEQIEPVVVAPNAIVETPPIAPPPVQTVAAPPPVAVAVVAPPPAKPALAAPVSVTDLSTSLRSGKAPSYPFESKKRHEEGTVVIALMVSVTGKVADASVFRTSGFPRLDQAALEAVRKFVYEPYVLNGQPVQVRTTVTFPFKLKA